MFRIASVIMTSTDEINMSNNFQNYVICKKFLLKRLVLRDKIEDFQYENEIEIFSKARMFVFFSLIEID